MSQKALADRICKCASAVSGYENDFQTPPVDVLISIARVLDVTLEFLVDYQAQEVYTVSNLQPQQKELVDLLFAEFAAPTNVGNSLSSQQLEILKKLMLIFSQKRI